MTGVSGLIPTHRMDARARKIGVDRQREVT